MPSSSHHVSRRSTKPRYASAFSPVSHLDFYREEFVKCQRCLEQQREHFSTRAVTDLERALARVMTELDALCMADDADEVVSRLLQQFEVVAGFAVWSDPSQIH